jgi:hypothetical protein
MHRNPVKRGLAAPEDWKWSSYRDYAFDEIGTVRINSMKGIPSLSRR